MKTEEFDYPLPKSLIAQYPAPERGTSRLMVVCRETGAIEHRSFKEVSHHLKPGDLLVINNTRVLPARLVGRKETGGRCEVLLLPQWNGASGEWKTLVKGIRNAATPSRVRFEQGVEAEIKEVCDGRATIRFFGRDPIPDILQRIGRIPLPPYIKRPDEPPDRTRYQTVYAERDGSVAAPTAGLHFTEELTQSLKESGVAIVPITLHIGPGTFKPVKAKDVEDHAMEAEWTEISEESAQKIERTRRDGGRIFAVGTTVTRALESFCSPEGEITPGVKYSSLFIYPPYRFRIVGGMVTNFHLPQSTLVMLVSAFAGKDLLMRAYREAVALNYRFYSYGDAMLIL